MQWIVKLQISAVLSRKKEFFVPIQCESKRALWLTNYILWSINPISRHLTDYAILAQNFPAPIAGKENKQGLMCRWRPSVIFLNNQPDGLIVQTLFCYKTLHVSGNLFAHHQEFSAVHSALVSFIQVSDDRFQVESGWNCSSILILLGRGHQKPAWNLPVPNVQ